jgi:hypothetical protein
MDARPQQEASSRGIVRARISDGRTKGRRDECTEGNFCATRATLGHAGIFIGYCVIMLKMYSNQNRIEFETILSLDDSTDWKDRSCPQLAGVFSEVRKRASSSSSSVGTGEVVGDTLGSAGCSLECLSDAVHDDGCLGLDVVV